MSSISGSGSSSSGSGSGSTTKGGGSAISDSHAANHCANLVTIYTFWYIYTIWYNIYTIVYNIYNNNLRSFLALGSYFRRFLPAFAERARGLYKVTGGHKKKLIEWTEELTAARGGQLGWLRAICSLKKFEKSGTF